MSDLSAIALTANKQGTTVPNPTSDALVCPAGLKGPDGTTFAISAVNAGMTLNPGSSGAMSIGTAGASLTLGQTGVDLTLNSDDIVFAKEVNHVLQVTTTTTSDTAGGVLQVIGGAGDGSGAGGEFAGIGGAGGATGTGGESKLWGGAGGATSGNGGLVDINGGDATSGTGGAVDIDAGSSSSGAGGDVTIHAGNAGTSGNGGAVTIDAGALAGGGTDGIITIGGTNAESVTIGRATKTTTVNGTLAANDINMTNGQIDSTGTLDIEATGVIQIGNDAVAAAINIGTGAAARAISIGNAASASLTLEAGVGALNMSADAASTWSIGGSLNFDLLGGLDMDVTGAADIDASTTITIGGTNATGVNVGRTGQTTTIKGDLVVDGTTTTVHSENVNIADNHLNLNAGYTTVSAQTGGLDVNYLPTATTDTSTTGGFAAGGLTVNTVGAATFAANDFIQVSGAANPNNDGIYEVASHAANVLTIKSSPVFAFCNNAFTVDTTDTSAVITKINVALLQCKTDGVFQTGKGADSATMTASLADIASATLGWDDVLGNDAHSGANDAYVDDDQVLYFGTGGDGAMTFVSASSTWTFDLAGAGGIEINASTGPIRIGNDAVAENIFIGSAGDREIQIGSTSITGQVLIESGPGSTIDIGVAGNTHTISIGTGAASQIVQIGSGNTTSSASLDAGTGGITIGGSSAARTIAIGNTGAVQTINMATSSQAHIISIGDGNGAGNASSLSLDAGTGGIDIGTSADARTINVGTGAAAQTINIGTGAAAHVITIGNDGANAAAVTVKSGTTGDITFDARGMTTPMALNTNAEKDLVGFTATALIPALNELKADQTGNALEETVTAGEALAIYRLVFLDTTDSAEAKAADADVAAEGHVYGVTTAAIGDGSTGTVITHGRARVKFITGGAPTVGNPCFLSLTAGEATDDVSAFTSGDSIVRLGIIYDITNYAGGDTDETCQVTLNIAPPILLS